MELNNLEDHLFFYLINKPKGITSQQAISKVKNIAKVKKVGHTGTLDPFATGLLVVGVNKSTKLIEFFKDFSKTYEGKIKFGFSTDTDDYTGNILSENKFFELNFDKLEEIIGKKFIGKIKQIPPNYSAINVNGERAYKLSRENKSFNLEPKSKFIYEFKISKTNEPNVISFKITVSSGTYIRSIARDLGLSTMGYAHLIELNRTAIGNMNLGMSNNLEQDKSFKRYPINKILPFIKIYKVNNIQIKQLLDGKKVHLEIIDYEFDLFILYTNHNCILAKRIDKNFQILKNLSYG